MPKHFGKLKTFYLCNNIPSCGVIPGSAHQLYTDKKLNQFLLFIWRHIINMNHKSETQILFYFFKNILNISQYKEPIFKKAAKFTFYFQTLSDKLFSDKKNP